MEAEPVEAPRASHPPRPLLWAIVALALSAVVLAVSITYITPLAREASAMSQEIQNGQQAESARLQNLVKQQPRLPEDVFLERLGATTKQSAESWGKLWKPLQESHGRLARARTGERLGLWLSTAFCLAAGVALLRRARRKEGDGVRLRTVALVCLCAWVLTGTQLVPCERLAYRAHGGFSLPEVSLFPTSPPRYDPSVRDTPSSSAQEEKTDAPPGWTCGTSRPPRGAGALEGGAQAPRRLIM